MHFVTSIIFIILQTRLAMQPKNKSTVEINFKKRFYICYNTDCWYYLPGYAGIGYAETGTSSSL